MFKKIGIIAGIMLLVGPLLAMLDMKELDLEKAVLLVVQLAVGGFLLYSALSIDLGSERSLLRFKNACYGVIAYISAFCIWFAFSRSYLIDQSIAFAFIVLVVGAICSAPFLWCVKKVSGRLTQ